MKQPRALLKPYVWQAEDPETTAIRTPLDNPDNCHESILTPEEAIQHGTDVIKDGLRAMHMRDVNARLRKRAN